MTTRMNVSCCRELLLYSKPALKIRITRSLLHRFLCKFFSQYVECKMNTLKKDYFKQDRLNFF